MAISETIQTNGDTRMLPFNSIVYRDLYYAGYGVDPNEPFIQFINGSLGLF